MSEREITNAEKQGESSTGAAVAVSGGGGSGAVVTAAVSVAVAASGGGAATAVTAAVVSGGGAVGRGSASSGGRRADMLVAIDDWVEKKRGFLLIALSLLASWALQAAINPPGGVWTDDNVLVDLEGNLVLKDGKPVYLGVAEHSEVTLYPHRAGYSILARNDPGGYCIYNYLNIEIVVSSAFCFTLLISKLNRRHYGFGLLVIGLWTCISATFFNFVYVSYALMPPGLADANTHCALMNPMLFFITTPVLPVLIGVLRIGASFLAWS